MQHSRFEAAAEIINDHLVLKYIKVPKILPEHLDGTKYFILHQKVLPRLLEVVLTNVRARMLIKTEAERQPIISQKCETT